MSPLLRFLVTGISLFCVHAVIAEQAAPTPAPAVSNGSETHAVGSEEAKRHAKLREAIEKGATMEEL